MKLLLSLLLVLLSGCAAHVSHPTKSEPEMRADIQLCTRQANHKYWMDPIAALYNAYDCLEAKGYQRDKADLTGRVERAMGENRAQPKSPAKPCKVPCRRRP
ncbi:MAG: hypothetical protein ACXW2T_05390 [Allosphingosinicella sp.]